MRQFGVALFLAVNTIRRGSKVLFLLTFLMMVGVYIDLVYTPALLNGLVAGTNDKLISTYSSHVVVEPTHERYIHHASRLLAGVRSMHGVVGASSRLKTVGEIRSGDNFGTWELDGINPIADEMIFTTSQRLVEGSYLTPGDTDSILLGIQIAGGPTDTELRADSLKGVHVGNTVTVTYPNGTAHLYRVKGIFKTGFIQSDIRAYITQSEFARHVADTEDSASEINVKLLDPSKAHAAAEEMSYLQGGLKFVTWEEKAGVIKTMTESFGQINATLRIIALAGAAGVVFVMTYIYLINRRRQLGIERAIGIPVGTLTMVHVIRSLVFGCYGSVVGYLIFVFLIAPYQAAHPYKFPTGNVVLVTSNSFLALNMGILIGISLISAVIPARIILSEPIMDSLSDR